MRIVEILKLTIRYSLILLEAEENERKFLAAKYWATIRYANVLSTHKNKFEGLSVI